MKKNKKKSRRKLAYRFHAFTGSEASGINSDPLFGPGTLLLEQCSSDSVREWHSRGQRLLNYNFKWFFELESQRAAYRKEITESLTSVRGITVNLDSWCRGIKYRYADSPLSVVGSLKQSGRFNFAADIDPTRFPPFPALYAASDRETAYREMFGVPSSTLGSLSGEDLALQKKSSIVWLSLDGEIQNVFDLTKKRNLIPFVDVISNFTLSDDVHKLALELGVMPMTTVTNANQLHMTFMEPHWRGFAMNCDLPSNSQIFGQLLSAAGFEGVLYNSTKTNALALAVFTRQLKNSASWISVNDAPPSVQVTRLDSSNYLECERP